VPRRWRGDRSDRDLPHAAAKAADRRDRSRTPRTAGDAGRHGSLLHPDARTGLREPGHRVKHAAYLQPGQLHVSAEPTVISTVLGSCVAVCLWDAERSIGGANHYLLPDGAPNAKAPLRYAASAVL